MVIINLYQHIKLFYKTCNKPTLWLSLIVLNQVIGFTPGVPSVVLYATLLVYAIYQLTRPGNTCNWGIMGFLIYIPLALLISSPDAVFRSWERFVLFALLVVCVSPLLTSGDMLRNRQNMFQILLSVCVFIGVGSFFARFLGISFYVHCSWSST